MFRPETETSLIPILLLVAPLLAGPLEQGEEGFLRSVLRRDLDVRAESLDLESVREARGEARSGLGPQFDLSGGAGSTVGSSDRSARQIEGTAVATQWVPTGGTLAGELHGGRTRLDDGANVRDIDTAGAQVSFTQPLLRGFGAGSAPLHAARQAELALKVKISGSRSVVLARIQEARTAYWKQIALDQIVSMRVQDSGRTASLLQAARIRFSAGAVSEYDTLSALAEHLQSVSDLLTARGNRRSGMRTLLGWSDTTEVALPVLDSGALPPTPDSLAPDSAALLSEALRQAPTVAQALAQVEKASEQKTYLGVDRLPTFDVTGLAATDLLEGGWVLGAKAKVEWLLPNGTARSKYRQALLDLHANEVRAEQAKKEISRQIGRLVEAIAASRAQQDVTIRLSQANNRKLAAAEAGWRLGRTAWTDYVASRRDAIQAQSNAWQALAAVKALEAELEARTGTGPARLGWTGGDE
jgi:outer membrane protein TolC